MIVAAYLVLTAAAAGFAYRLARGPSLADRVVGLDGLLICGTAAITVDAMRTGDGAFLPVAVVTTLVGFVSTAMVARYIERRGRVITEFVVLVGSTLILLAAVGVVRFDDALTRMHALTKASTLGLVLVLIGAAFHLDDPNDITSLALAAGLQLLTSPVAAHLIGRATYRDTGVPRRTDTTDELAERARSGGGDAPDS